MLKFKAPQADTWAAMGQAHGYHVCSRVELEEPWFPDGKLLAKAPNLLAVCSLGAGYDVIDVDACNQAGILVCNQSGGNSEAVAEHAMGFMLALSKKIMLSDRAMRKQANLERFLYTGNDLLGKTVGIIGLGNIGGRVAELCKGLFRMTVLAYDPYLTKEQIAAKGAQKVELDELIPRADYLTMHSPRTKETFGMMGYDQFARMKPTAYFINTSREGFKLAHDISAYSLVALTRAALPLFEKAGQGSVLRHLTPVVPLRQSKDHRRRRVKPTAPAPCGRSRSRRPG